MLASLSFPDDIRPKDRVRAYAVDRNERLEDLYELYPQLRGMMPSELVENVLTDVCLYFIEERPLPRGQLALCNVGAKKVKFNSMMVEFVNSKNVDLLALRRCTMAHELGHVRLHQDEMADRMFISFQHDGRFQDARAYQKEDEADLYAAIFLVPEERLMKATPFQALIEARQNEKELTSGQLWRRVYQLCEIFGVTKTLMCRALKTYGWIVYLAGKRNGLHDLRLVGKRGRRT